MENNEEAMCIRSFTCIQQQFLGDKASAECTLAMKGLDQVVEAQEGFFFFTKVSKKCTQQRIEVKLTIFWATVEVKGYCIVGKFGKLALSTVGIGETWNNLHW